MQAIVPIRDANRNDRTSAGSLLVEATLDWAERLLVLGLYGWLVYRLLASAWAGGSKLDLLLLPSEGLVVVFMLLRRRASVLSRNWGDWLLAIVVTCAPMGVRPAPAVLPLYLQFAAATVLMMGTLIQLHAKFTLGRSIGCVPAHRGLRMAGPYQFVRHPMYAGYLLSHLAFLALNPTLWNLAVYAVASALQIPRLLAEERLLCNDPLYSAYQSRVRYRLVPGLF